MSHDQILVITIFIISLALLLWFIYSMNCINSSLVEIVEYTRRTALSLPLTTDQVKLINRKIAPADIVAILENQGAVVKISVNLDADGYVHDALEISKTGTVDSELVKLAWANGHEILKYLQAMTAQAALNDNLPKK